MNGSLSLGRIAGIPLRVHWSAPLLIIVLAVGLGDGTLPAWAPGHSGGAYRTWAVVGALLLAVSLVAHEGAHALTARRAKVEVKDVTVFALGGVTRMGTPATARDEGLIAAAGPLTSLLLGGLGLAATVVAHDVLHWALPAAVLAWASWANIVLAAFNLVPAAPLDGGRILQAVVWRIRGDRERAARVAARCGQVAGALMVVGGWLMFLSGAPGGLWLALVGLFVSVTAMAEARRSTVFEALRGVRAGDAMHPVVTGQDWQTVDRVLAETVPGAPGQSVLPLTDFDGRPSGVVAVSALTAVPVAQRPVVRAREVAAPLARVVLADPGDQVTDLLERAGTAAGGPVLVVKDQHIVGMITPQDIAALVQRPPGPPRPPTAGAADRGH
jgi:Zn-dependent protease